MIYYMFVLSVFQYCLKKTFFSPNIPRITVPVSPYLIIFNILL